MKILFVFVSIFAAFQAQANPIIFPSINNEKTLVEKNDEIIIQWKSREIVTIEWQQNFSQKKEDFYLVLFTVKGGDLSASTSMLFVEVKEEDSFKKLLSETEDGLTLTVSSDFQYGQDKNQTTRFLVYHDKRENMYQHRFGTNKIVKTMKLVVDNTPGFVEAILPQLSYLEVVFENAKAYLGDPLREF